MHNVEPWCIMEVFHSFLKCAFVFMLVAPCVALGLACNYHCDPGTVAVAATLVGLECIGFVLVGCNALASDPAAGAPRAEDAPDVEQQLDGVARAAALPYHTAGPRPPSVRATTALVLSFSSARALDARLRLGTLGLYCESGLHIRRGARGRRVRHLLYGRVPQGRLRRVPLVRQRQRRVAGARVPRRARVPQGVPCHVVKPSQHVPALPCRGARSRGGQVCWAEGGLLICILIAVGRGGEGAQQQQAACHTVRSQASNSFKQAN